MAYSKPLKTIVIKTLGGTTINAADTATDPIASDALAEFDAFKTMHVRGKDSVTEVPFHAVDNITVSVETTEVEKADPYGCEA